MVDTPLDSREFFTLNPEANLKSNTILERKMELNTVKNTEIKTSGKMSLASHKPTHALGILVAGIAFGIILTQSEAASFWRIHEMFHFQSIHMYGLLGMTVALTSVWFAVVRRFHLRDIDGNTIVIAPKDSRWKRTLLGGLIFGLGWGLAGACPGPIFVLIGQGYLPALVMLAAAMGGAWAYGLLRERLWH
jgi:uncharacterized membrane protein YedE/YeeE